MSNQNEGKVIFVGQANTGKTCLLHALLNEEFRENIGTTINPGFSNFSAQDSSGILQKMKLWDTSGQERYQSLSKIFFREADVAVICFDASENGSIESTKPWIDLVLTESPSCQLIIAGTKEDLLNENQTSKILLEADSFFEKYNPNDIIITSSKTNRNIDLLGTSIANCMSDKSYTRRGVIIDFKDTDKNSCC